jgi:hypothetical protein
MTPISIPRRPRFLTPSGEYAGEYEVFSFLANNPYSPETALPRKGETGE